MPNATQAAADLVDAYRAFEAASTTLGTAYHDAVLASADPSNSPAARERASDATADLGHALIASRATILTTSRKAHDALLGREDLYDPRA